MNFRIHSKSISILLRFWMKIILIKIKVLNSLPQHFSQKVPLQNKKTTTFKITVLVLQTKIAFRIAKGLLKYKAKFGFQHLNLIVSIPSVGNCLKIE